MPTVLVVGVLLVFVVPVTIVSVPLAEDAHAARDWIREARQTGVRPPSVLTGQPGGRILTRAWQRSLGRPGGISDVAGKAAHGSLTTLARTLAQEAANRLVLVGVMLLALLFLLRDGEDVVSETRTTSRRIFGDAGEDVGEQVVKAVRGMVDGRVVVGLGEGVVIGIAYAVVGVPHPALFGLITAMLAMVPFGAAVAIVISAGALFPWGSATAAAVIGVLGLMVTFAADHFVRSALIGGATRLPFLWVLFGILGGVEAWGLVGLFIGPAIMAAVVMLWQKAAGKRPRPLTPEWTGTDLAMKANWNGRAQPTLSCALYASCVHGWSKCEATRRLAADRRAGLRARLR